MESNYYKEKIKGKKILETFQGTGSNQRRISPRMHFWSQEKNITKFEEKARRCAVLHLWSEEKNITKLIRSVKSEKLQL